jgi:hypothetical protein
MKKILLGLFILTAVTGQSETRCFFTEIVVTVLVTRCFYDILTYPNNCNGYCENHKLCEKIQQLRERLKELEYRIKYLEK